MIDSATPCQAGLITVLKAIDFGQRVGIYDEPPAEAAYPYVCVGKVTPRDDSADFYAGSEVSFDLHICDNSVGSTRAKAIGRLITPAIDAAIAVDGFTVVIFENMGAVYAVDFETHVRGVVVQRYELSPNP